MLTPMSIAERALGLALGAGDTALKAAGGLVDAMRGGGGDDRPAPAKTAITDTALARKVESELFRDQSVPKGKINVNAVGRVVSLRGEARTPQMVNDLQARALAIPEVDSVENLLHLPKTPARKPRSAKGAATGARKRPRTAKVNAERPSAKGEPTPKQMAARREGRKAAPLGSTGADGRKSGSAAPKRPATKRVNEERQTGKGEPTPKEMAAKGQGRRAAPLGSTPTGSNGGSSKGGS